MEKRILRKVLTLSLLVSVNTVFAQEKPESLWVTFKNAGDVPVSNEGLWLSSNKAIQNLIKTYTITNVEQALPDSRNEKLRQVYQVDCWCDRDELAEAMTRTPGLEKPERAPEYELLNDPNDYSTIFQNDYALDLIKAKEAWSYNTGDATVVLGISDGSFYDNHEELTNKVQSVTTLTNPPSSYVYHGTAVSITAAGNTNNALGKSSIGYNCRLALNTMGYNQMIQLSNEGVKVLNVSWTSGCWWNSYYQDIIDEIYDNGTIIVAAAGNGNATCGNAAALVYPAALDHVIAVTSIGPSNNHERHIGDSTSTHQHNSAVDICAPGYDVALTVAPGWYLTGNGSSFAAPYVTGTIGLMLSLRPCLTYEEVLEILSYTAVNIDAQNPNYVGMLGAGRLNAGRALRRTSLYNCSLLADATYGSKAGTEEFSGVMSAKLFPNPSNMDAELIWDESRDMELIVLAMDGTCVLKQSINSTERRTSINPELPGVYFVQLVENGEVVWKNKFVKL